MTVGLCHRQLQTQPKGCTAHQCEKGKHGELCTKPSGLLMWARKTKA